MSSAETSTSTSTSRPRSIRSMRLTVTSQTQRNEGGTSESPLSKDVTQKRILALQVTDGDPEGHARLIQVYPSVNEHVFPHPTFLYPDGSIAYSDGYIYATGGLDRKTQKMSPRVIRMKVARFSRPPVYFWEECRPMMFRRKLHSSVAFQGNIYVFGGVQGKKPVFLEVYFNHKKDKFNVVYHRSPYDSPPFYELLPSSPVPQRILDEIAKLPEHLRTQMSRIDDYFKTEYEKLLKVIEGSNVLLSRVFYDIQSSTGSSSSGQDDGHIPIANSSRSLEAVENIQDLYCKSLQDRIKEFLILQRNISRELYPRKIRSEVYKPAEDEWNLATVTSLKSPYLSTLVQADGALYALGGKFAKNGKYPKKIRKFNTDHRNPCGRWKVVGKTPHSRGAGCAAVAVGQEIYLIGGRYALRKKRPSVQVYHTVEKTWRDVTEPKHPRWLCSACVVAGEIYVTGGFDKNDDAVHMMERYSPSTGTWEELWRISGIFQESLVAICDDC